VKALHRGRAGSRRARAIWVLLALVALLAGCTGVPESSKPQVVRSGLNARPAAQVPSPAPGADQRTIVSGFLAANAAVDAQHVAARAFLTPEAKNRWSDSTVTVIDSAQISNGNADNQVTARGRVIGTIDASGVYTPRLQGDGSGVGETPVTFTFGLVKSKGQWRIDQLQNGLLIDEGQFQRYYQPQRSVYFYDLAELHLVPDPRYTSLSDSQLLANWLIKQLSLQPRPQLQGAVSTELPAQTSPTVTMGATVKVAVPGARQLDSTTRNRLAGQIALTLDQVDPGQEFSITDNGKPVTIPVVGGTEFSASEFQQSPGHGGTAHEPRSLFYIRTGAVWTAAGKPMPGPLGKASNGLHSVALADLSGSKNLAAAGTAGPAHKYRLLVGTQQRGLHPTGLVGDLSRPAWVPGMDELWVGDGSRIFRVANGGKPAEVSATTGSGKIAGTVTALRFSPEGSRIALVLTLPDHSAQLWVGAVVRNGSQVRVDNLQAISPSGVAITDAAWNDELMVFAIGTDKATGRGDVFEVQCDGSLWSPKGIGNLPMVPDSITVAKGQPAAVSSDRTLWVQGGDNWVGLNGGTSTSGTHPIYVE
jgi:hypothetical protein